MTSGYAIATLVLFLVSIFFVIRPVTIPTPHHFPRIPINLTTAPILAIALLWAAQCLDLMVIRNGIVVTEGIKPYNILIHVFSLAYMAITLEITGVLEAAAFWVSNMSGRTGWKVYLHFVMLAPLSIPLGNDPAMLSGTVFLFYYTKAAELDSWAWVMAEFAAVNVASIVLFVGNPTNVVICEGFGVNHAAFTAYTILPFLACNVFATLAFQYRNKVPPTLARTARRDPREALLDPVGAWVGSIMLGTTLMLCLVASFFGIDVWMISLPFAVGKFLFDLTWDHCRRTHGVPIADRGSPRAIGKADYCAPIAVHQRAEDTSAYCPSPDEDRSQHSLIIPLERHLLNTSMSPKMVFDEASSTEERHHTQNGPLHHSSLADTRRSPSFPPDKGIAIESQPGTSNSESKMKLQPSAPKSTIKFPRVLIRFRAHVDYRCDQLVAHFPTFFAALPRLPFALVPFMFSQIIFIEALNHQGWVQVFANWLVRATGNQIHPTIWLIGVLGVVLCNLASTNIGATILLTKVVLAAALPCDANCAVAITLAVGLTFSASLAGLLWRTILAQKDTHVRQRAFALWSLLPMVVMTGVGLRVVSAVTGPRDACRRRNWGEG